MQKIIQEFDADITQFKNKVGEMGKIVDDLGKKSKTVKFNIDANKLSRDLTTITKNLNSIKNVKFDVLERRVTSLTDKLKPLNAELSQTASHLTSITRRSASTVARISDLVREVVALNRQLTTLGATSGGAANGVSNLSNNLNRTNGFFGSMFGSIQRLLPFLSALFVVNTVIQFAQELYNVNRQYELFELKAKSALYGSKLAVDEYYASLQRIDIKSLFDIEELEGGLVKLLNRRVRLTEEQLQSLADTAESVGTKGAQSFNQIVDALLDAQVGQFKRIEELGVGVDATGDKLKLTFAGVTTEVGKGTQAIVQYILGMSKMNGASELSSKAASTLEGKISSLKTSFDNLIKKIGEMGVIDAFKSTIDGASTLLGWIERIIVGYGRMKDAFNENKHLNYGLIGGAAGFAVTGFNPAGAIAGYALGETYSRTTDMYNNRRGGLDVETPIKRGPEFERMAKKLISINDELYERGKSRNGFNQFYFNPANFNTQSLKDYISSMEQLVVESKKLGFANDLGVNGRNYKLLTERLGVTQQELTARQNTKPDKVNQGALNQAERLSDLERSADEKRIESSRNIEEKLKQIKIEAMKERLRFEEEGSKSYLNLKREIGLKEIELDREKARNSLREQMTQSTAYVYKNKAGKYDIGYNTPTESEVTAKFAEENEVFNMRTNLMNKLTDKEIEERNSALVEKQKSLFEKISEFVESSQDKEKRAILQKYTAIQSAIKQLRDTGLIPEQKVFVDAYDEKIRILEEFELKLLEIKNSQKGSIENSRSSVEKLPKESNYSYSRRVESAGIQQSIDNQQELIGFSNFFALEYPNLKDDPQFQEILSSFEKGVQEGMAKLKESMNKQSLEFDLGDSLIAKVFNIDKDSPEAKSQLALVKKSLNELYSVYQDFISSLIDLEKKKEQQYDDNIKKLESRLSEEEALRKAGASNSYDTVRRQIEAEDALKQRSVDKQIQLQKLQIISNAIYKESEMALLVVKLLNGASGIPFPGNVIAAGITMASMIALAGTSIAQIKSVSKAERGLFVDGKRHNRGGEIVEVEDGESIIQRPSSMPNKQFMLNLNNFKKKITSDNVKELFANTNIQMPSENRENYLSVIGSYNRRNEEDSAYKQAIAYNFSTLESILGEVAENTSRISKEKVHQLRDGSIMIENDGNIKILKSHV